MDKKNVWKLVIQTLITILTAIGTTLGVHAAVVLRGGLKTKGGGAGVAQRYPSLSLSLLAGGRG